LHGLGVAFIVSCMLYRLLRRRPSVVKGGGPDLGVRHGLPRDGRGQVNSGCATPAVLSGP
jgi:hypothetical protein